MKRTFSFLVCLALIPLAFFTLTNVRTAQASAGILASTGVTVVCDQPVASAFTCTATPSGGVEPYSFTWTVDSVYRSTSSNPVFDTVLTTGTHTIGVTATDVNNVASSEATVVVDARPLVVTISCDQPLASAFTCTATSSDGKAPFYFQWTVDATVYQYYAQAPTFSTVFSTAGTHAIGVTVQDSNGVTSSEATVTVDARPLTVTVVCEQPYASAFTCVSTPSDGKAPFYFQWTVDATVYAYYSQSSTFNPVLSAGTHTIGVTAQDSNGIFSSEATVTVVARPLIVTVVCEQPFASAFTCVATPSDGKQPYYFQWTVDGSVYRNYDTPVTFSIVVTTGSHTIGVIAQDSNGVFSSKATATVVARPLIVTVECPQPFASEFTCSATPSDGKEPYYFRWTVDSIVYRNYDTPSTFNVALFTTGTHIIGVTVQDQNGVISNEATAIVDARPLIVTVSCDQPFASAFGCTATPSDVKAPNYFRWTVDGTVYRNYDTPSTFSIVLSTGSHTIGVTVQDSNGVPSTEATVIVSARPLTVAILCDQPSSSIVACTATPGGGGREPYYFQWTVDGTVYRNYDTPSTFSITLSSGTHIMGVRVSDSSGVLSGETTTTVIVYPLGLEVSLGCTPATKNIPVTCSATGSGGTEPYNYAWTLDGVLQTDTGSSFTHTFSVEARHTVQVAVTDSTTPTALFNVASKNLLVATQPLGITITCGTALVGDPLTCDATAIGGISPYTFTWTVDGQTYAYNAISTFTTTFSVKGPHVVGVKATDAVNTVSSEVTATVTIDPFDYSISITPTVDTVTLGSHASVTTAVTVTVTVTHTSPAVKPITLTYYSYYCNYLGYCVGQFSPPTVTPTSTGAVSTLTLTINPSLSPGVYTFTISAYPQGDTPADETVTYTLTVEPSPTFDFDVSVYPSSASIVQGTGTTPQVTVTLTSGTGQTVDLSISGLPAGVDAVFTTISRTPTFYTPMAITTMSTTLPGVYVLTITGTGGGVTKTATFTLTVIEAFDYSVSITPTIDTQTLGSHTSVTATLTVTVTQTSPATKPVTLSIFSYQCYYSYCGIVTEFSPPTVTPTNTGVVSVMTMTLPPSLSPGIYTFAISAYPQGDTPADETATYTLTVVPSPILDFDVSMSPASWSVVQGAGTTPQVYVTLTSGTTTTVDLSASGLPAGADAVFTTSSGNPSFSTAMAITTSSTTLPGIYAVTITGTGGGITRIATFTLTIIEAFDYSISITPSADTVANAPTSLPATITVTVTQTSPATKPVNLSIFSYQCYYSYCGIVTEFSQSTITPTMTGAVSVITLHASGVTPGVYTFTITGSPQGDTPADEVATYTLTVVAGQPVAVTVSCGTATAGTPVTCYASATDGTPPYSYQWKVDGTSVPEVGSSVTRTFDVRGTHSFSVVVTDANQISTSEATATATIIPLDLTVIIGCGTGTIFVGEPFSCVALVSGGTSPYTFTWTVDGTVQAGETASSILITLNSQGAHTISATVTDVDNVSKSGSTIATLITHVIPLTVTVSCGTAIVSQPVTCTATASGGTLPYTYEWHIDQTPQQETSSSFTTTFTTAGTHTIYGTVADTKGVIATGFATLTVQPEVRPLTISIACDAAVVATPFRCTALPLGGTSPYSFSWTIDSVIQLGETASSFATTLATKGSYVIGATVTDSTTPTALVKTASTTVKVTGPQPTISIICATATAGVPLTCDATVSGGTAPFTFTWKVDGTIIPGETLSSFSTTFLAKSTHTISVFVTDADTLISTEASATVNVLAPELTVVVSCGTANSQTPFTCTATPSGGTPSYSFTWTLDSVLQTETSSSFTTSLVSGTQTIGVKATDADRTTSTEATTSVHVNVPALTVVLTCDNAIAGTPLSCTTIVTGGVSPYSYTWILDSILQTQTGPSFTTTFATKGSHTLELTITDADTPAQTKTVGTTILVAPLPVTVTISCNAAAVAGNPVTCTASASGGTAPFIFTWKVDEVAQSETSSSFSTSFSTMGTHVITVTATDVDAATSTPASASVVITLQPTTVTLTCGTAVAGTPVTCSIEASGGLPPYAFTWAVDGRTQPGATSSSFTITFAVGGVHTITGTATDANDVSASKDVRLTVEQAKFDVVFSQSGLDSSTEWCVTLTGTKCGITQTITFQEPAGGYVFAVGTVQGFTHTPPLGSLLVADSSITVNIVFTPETSLGQQIPAGDQPVAILYNPSNGYIYVANFGSGTVTVIDGTRVIATLVVGTQPIALTFNPENNYVYVANFGSSNLSIISDVQVLGQVDVGTQPRAFAVDPTTGFVYVANFGSSSVSVVRDSTVVSEVLVGSRPIALVYNPSNTFVYVANFGEDSVSIITSSFVVDKVSVGSQPAAAIYHPINHCVYVVNSGANTVSVICERIVTRTLPAPGGSVGGTAGYGGFGAAFSGFGGPGGFAGSGGICGSVLNPRTGATYYVNCGSGKIFIGFPPILSCVTFRAVGLAIGTTWYVSVNGNTLSAKTDTISFDLAIGDYTFFTGARGYLGSPSTGTLTLTIQDICLKIDISFAIVHPVLTVYTIPVGKHPVALVYNPYNCLVYVANSESNTVSIISGLEVVGTVDVGLEPVALAFNPVNGFVYVVNRASNTVSTIDGILVTGSVAVGLGPTALTVDPSTGYVYVVNTLSNTISIIVGTQLLGSQVLQPITGSGLSGTMAYDACTGLLFEVNPETGIVSASVIDASIAPDKTPPVLTTPSAVSMEAAGPAGATVEFAVSAVDDVDGLVPVTCDHASGAVYGLGATVVTCSAVDSSGNVGSASFTINVLDTIAPVIAVPSTITVEATSSLGTRVHYVATAADIVSGFIVPQCSPSSDSIFPPGTTTVTCVATDAAGNRAVSAFNVIVRDIRPTTTTVDCTPSTIVINQATSCTATVVDAAPGTTSTPTGTVTFTPGGSCTLASGSCSVSMTPTATGSFQVSASYGGDSTHDTSSGSATVTVNPRTTSTTIVCTPSTVVTGQASSCTATVADTSLGTGTTPTGTVTWTQTNTGTFSAATCTLFSGSCSVNYTPSATGSHTITGSYGSDTTHVGSNGSAIVTVRNPPDFSIVANTSTLIIPQGYGNSSRITLSSLGNFQGTVGLTFSSSVFGSCYTPSVSLQPGGTASFFHCLYASRSVPVGTYTVSITGTSGSLVHTVSISVVVVSSATLPGISISASPSSLVIPQGTGLQSSGNQQGSSQGQLGTTTLTVRSINGYSGRVTLIVSAPFGSSYSISSITFVLRANGFVNVNFAISSIGLPIGRAFYTISAFSPAFNPATKDGKFDSTVVTVDVTVPSPAQASQSLIKAVNSLPLSSSAKTSLLGPMNNIVNILSDNNPANDISACGKLSSFINIVDNDQRRGILTLEQAAQLRQLATSIMTQLGC